MNGSMDYKAFRRYAHERIFLYSFSTAISCLLLSRHTAVPFEYTLVPLQVVGIVWISRSFQAVLRCYPHFEPFLRELRFPGFREIRAIILTVVLGVIFGAQVVFWVFFDDLSAILDDSFFQLALVQSGSLSIIIVAAFDIFYWLRTRNT